MSSFVRMLVGVTLFFVAEFSSLERSLFAENVDLSHAHVLVRAGDLPAAEKIAPVILIEETNRRTGLSWQSTNDSLLKEGPRILLASVRDQPQWKDQVPAEVWQQPVLTRAEGYCIRVLPPSETETAQVFIIGSDARGVMFGVGHLLRRMNLLPGIAGIDSSFHVETSPDRAMRGHQVGYRARANSWDAWTKEQFEQYFRDLVVFGANCMENIPFQDTDVTPLMKYSREEMNLHFANLCMKYDLDHWLWVPVEFDVNDQKQANEFLQQQEEFYRKCPRLDAVFVPGGDPGDNPAGPLMPYLERMANSIQKYHPHAKLWLSLQGFSEKDVDDFYLYIEQHQPAWFGGAVMGPSSPGMEITRQRLPKRYPLRWYPDITHIVRCQYPVPWLDPAWGVTIGREPVNPRPEDYRAIYENDYRLTDGFLSYSDGIHDDLNKNLWTQMAWNPQQSTREILQDYARFFFRSDLADIGADALAGLETNLRGPVVGNGSIDGTFRLWQQIETTCPTYTSNWRLEMHLFRAYYDLYTRHRHLYEVELERLAMEQLQDHQKQGIAQAIPKAIEILNRAEHERIRPDLLKRIESMGESLYHSIGYQTSVPKYQASGSERGCMIDFVNYPLNNRWWLEDQLNGVLKLGSPVEQSRQIKRIVNWENPGPGGYYEVLGHVGRSPRMVKLSNAGDAMRHYVDIPMPTQRNMGEKRRSLRYSWHTYHDSIPSLKYDALDSQTRYTIKLFAQRESPLMIDGVLAKRIRKGETFDEVTEQEFEVPAEAVKDSRIELTWAPLDESHLNWRQKHYVTDLWVIPHPEGK